MFSLKNFLSTEKSHLPIGFDPEHGIRSLFPKDAGTIKQLEKYVFRKTSSSTVQNNGVQILFGADGDGRWLLGAAVNFADANSPVSVTISATFKVPEAAGCSVEITNGGSSAYNWAWITGVDPWIRDNWPDIFDGDCTFNQGIVFALQGSQVVGGWGNIPGQQNFSGTVVSVNGEPPNVYGPANISGGGLPVSAGSDYWYYSYGGGYYKSGRHDPWGVGFNYEPLYVDQTSGAGTGVIVGTGPDPSTQTGEVGHIVLSGNSRAVFVVLLNNTEDTVLTIQNPNYSGPYVVGDLPSPILPKTAVAWYTSNSGFLQGTQGTVQYYPSKLGSCPAPSSNDPTALVTFNWDNPEWGDNAYSLTAPPQFSTGWEGGDGNIGVVIIRIQDA